MGVELSITTSVVMGDAVGLPEQVQTEGQVGIDREARAGFL